MIFFAFGLPSAFADWCETVLTEIVRRKCGSVELVNANTLEDLGASLVRTAASHMVFCSWFPSGQRLLDLITEVKAPFLLHRDDPNAAVAYLAGTRNHDLLTATRTIAQSYPRIARYSSLPGALCLSLARDELPTPTMIREIGQHFGFELSDTELADIHKAVAHGTVTRVHNAREQSWIDRDDDARPIVDGVSKGYVELFQAGKLGPLAWHRQLFLAGDKDEGVAGPIDLTGRPRYLVRGPYIPLPPGSWTAEIVFGCSKEAVGVSLLLDVCAGMQLSQTRMQPKARGVFEVNMRFTIEPSNDASLDIRIFSERSALEGLLSLSHVTLVPDHEPDWSKHATLTAELGLGAKNG